tara:strand:- start:1252 stop:2277 length:1026 start_codon:yes stop_codon:yes gene_type:complete
MNYLKNIKKLIFWKFILLYVIKPIYDFVWTYIINIHAKILLISWKPKSKDYFNLNKNNQLIIKNDMRISNISNELSKICTKDFLNKSREEMKTKSQYSQELFDRLDHVTKEKIINFASSDLIVNTVAKYLGVFPVLSRIYFYHNIPNANGEGEIKAQKWHKDGMGYKGLDFFISITDIDLNNGPFFFLKKNNPLGAFSRIEKALLNPIHGERNKISNEEFVKIYNESDIDSIVGPKGTCVIVDSYNCYHKGGYLLKGDRVMLRIAFDTIDSTVLNFDEEKYKSDNIFYYNKKHISNVNNKFLKFLHYKRSPFIKFFKISQKLLKFYQLLHFKINNKNEQRS